MVPTPYGVHWASKLIYRDLKSIAAECTKKVRALAGATILVPHECAQNEVSADLEAGCESIHARSGLPSTITTANNDSNAPMEAHEINLDNPTTTHTVPSTDSSAATKAVELAQEDTTTLYSLLSTKLTELYATRERDMPTKERWMFRGAWLLLHMATQYCASNPSYNILKDGSPHVDETVLLLEVIQHGVSKQLESPFSRVSRMPTTLYMRRNDEPSRHDSVFSTMSAQFSPHPSLLWYTVFAGAADRTKTIHAAKCLIEHVWAKEDATELLEIVGNPAKQLPEGDEAELRERLGHILYPEHHAHC